MTDRRFQLPTLTGLLLLTSLLAFTHCRKTPGTSTTTPSPKPTVDTTGKFQNPLLTSGPDPWTIYRDGYYYVTHTTGNNLVLYKTRSMSRLSSAPRTVVWTPPTSGPNSRNIWAPELHYVNNRWYIYYAADDGRNENHRMWVLENESADPTQGTWVSKGELELPEDKWAIDGTLLQHNGQLYFAWSGWPNFSDGQQDLYMCRLTNPWTAQGPRVRISTPELNWEKEGSPDVNEGPEFLLRNDKIFLVYSASHCSTDAYALGMLTASATADLLNPASWTKTPQPVFGPYARDGAYGVGHNSFFTTPDGTENWLLYHANPTINTGCSNLRSPRIQRFTWKADGSPDFGTPVPLSEWIKRPSGE
ncbi:glycosyl hydrolase family 43 [Fibrisoma montanum]|uniref:Glycosyl hydrolase family 43 n=1 Tax=Fibrisoma montanum TaxID=2305895 RepID=A0A418MDW2_9BACT|nr:glycoside hydrolase family 43 protein [Fibrisoma montanum]RIV24984.1 glycosyl hydrolase family 43 [Fibrisoma montanum]